MLYGVGSCSSSVIMQVPLFAFCNLYKVIPDVKVVSNLPALSVEEMIPSAVSDATLLAPQEVEVGCKCSYFRFILEVTEYVTCDSCIIIVG